MLEINAEVIESITVLTVKGRFDSYGAEVFDKEASLLSGHVKDLIVDVSQVDYISSLGIRSVLKLEKSLIARSGGLILVGIGPFLARVFELSGLLNQFRTAESIPIAIKNVRSRALGIQAREQIIDGRGYRVTIISDGNSKLDLWGVFPDLSDKALSAENLLAISLHELGPSFGIGGFGQNRFQAAEELGEFVAAVRIAGVVPADGHCISDFMVTESASDSNVYVGSAVGLSGEPAFFVEGEQDRVLSVAELTQDFFSMMANLEGRTPPIIAMVMFAETIHIVGSHFRFLSDIAASQYQTETSSDVKGIILIGIAVDEVAAKSSDDRLVSGLLEKISNHRLSEGLFFHGHGIKFKAFDMKEVSWEVGESIRRVADINRLDGVVHVEPETKIKNPKFWIYVPSSIRSGAEKRLKIEIMDETQFSDEWDIITRRIFSDAEKVVLTPIHGGFMSKTFHVTSYGMDGRRMLPTVLKIGSVEITRREQDAYHEYVEKYILNNTTMIMGKALYGDWAGLCYSFVGIGGPESKLSWLTKHYRQRPVEELIPIFETIFTKILKPWYGQPHWEEIYPYVEHNPMALFPGILDDAETVLGISPDVETLPCPELNMELPNPFYFLKHQYPLRKEYSRLWYKAVTHGDLNMQNILLDECENIYIIDFSETRPRNIVSDFARLEAILKVEMPRMENEEDLRALLEFEMAMADASALEELPPFTYRGSDVMVEKAYRIVLLLRNFADKVTLFETDIIPYLIALLEWTYPVVSYGSATLLQKRLAAYSAGIIVRKILDLEKT
jgi:anti-anti-sigma factor